MGTLATLLAVGPMPTSEAASPGPVSAVGPVADGPDEAEGASLQPPLSARS